MFKQLLLKFPLRLFGLSALSVAIAAFDPGQSTSEDSAARSLPVRTFPSLQALAQAQQSKSFSPPVANTFSVGTVTVGTVTEGLEVPWSIEFLPDASMLVAGRPGHVQRVRNGQLDPRLIAGLPIVVASGERGLIDIELHPQFPQNHWIYLSYTIQGNTDEGGDLRTRVSRFRLTDQELTDPRVIFSGVPGTGGAIHLGSRLAFGQDGKLYITLGERGDLSRPQNLQQLEGKALRLNEDGTVPQAQPGR